MNPIKFLSSIKKTASMAFMRSLFSNYDRNTVLAKCNDSGTSLKTASKRLQDDFEIVMAAVKNNGLAIQFASPRLKNNYEIVLASIANNPKIFHNIFPYLPTEMQMDCFTLVGDLSYSLPFDKIISNFEGKAFKSSTARQKHDMDSDLCPTIKKISARKI